MARKTWRDKFESAAEPRIEPVDKPFAGMPAGGTMLISSPREVRDVMTGLPPGHAGRIADLRRELARRHGTDGVCPTSTSIFARIVAEIALEEIAAGVPPEAVAPFWRTIDPADTLAVKLPRGPEFIREMRRRERAG